MDHIFVEVSRAEVADVNTALLAIMDVLSAAKEKQ